MAFIIYFWSLKNISMTYIIEKLYFDIISSLMIHQRSTNSMEHLGNPNLPQLKVSFNIISKNRSFDLGFNFSMMTVSSSNVRH